MSIETDANTVMWSKIKNRRGYRRRKEGSVLQIVRVNDGETR